MNMLCYQSMKRATRGWNFVHHLDCHFTELCQNGDFFSDVLLGFAIINGQKAKERERKKEIVN